ncbi:MAG: hypothetical protein H8D72_00910 [Planctomycetes bacterium]|nr:hypothetical protein [Planctomycetota bacterium]
MASLGAAAMLSILAPASLAQVEGYELTAGIPFDFFLVTGSRHNPEQDFLKEHWANVQGAFMDSGIIDDVLELASTGNPEAMGMMLEIHSNFMDLIEAVAWDTLDQEVVFGERLNVPVFSGNSVALGAPDMVFLFKTKAAEADATFDALVALGSGGLDQMKALSGIEMSLQPIEEHGMKFAVLDWTQLDPDAPDFPISIGHRGGTFALTMGPGVRSEVAALLAGVGTSRSIATTERFKLAFKGLPPGEDSFEYVDMPNLTSNMRDIFGMVMGIVDAELVRPVDGAEGDGAGMVSQEEMIFGMVKRAMDMALEAMSLTQYSATVSHTEGYSVFTESRSTLSPNALQNRFYPLIATSRPVADFSQYLPASTKSYSVSGGQDLDAVYSFMLDAIAEFGPMGEQALGMWAGIQQQVGFDMQRDAISWIDGETIQVDFELNGADAWVTRMKVKDEAMANEKLSMGLGLLPELLKMAAKENPMVMMLGINVAPSRDPRFEGFSNLQIGMLGQSMLCGVQDGWMIFGSSADAVALTNATAAGESPNALTNTQLMADSVRPKGAIDAASFTNYEGKAESIADMINGLTMAGGMITAMIEDPQGQAVAGEMLSMLGKLAPVIREIDFYRSSSSVSSFDGKAWHVRSVMNYAGPRAKAEQPTEGR